MTLPVTLCWHCDRALDDASGIDEEFAKPEAGAVSLCMYCGTVAIFEHDMRLRKPTEKELDDLGKDKEFRQKYVQFVWARQYVMLRNNLMRDREDPDR